MKPKIKIKIESKIKTEPMMFKPLKHEQHLADFKMESDAKSEQDSADFKMKLRKRPEGKIKLEGRLQSDTFKSEKDPADFKLKPKNKMKLESKIKTEPRMANSEQYPANFKIKLNDKIAQAK